MANEVTIDGLIEALNEANYSKNDSQFTKVENKRKEYDNKELDSSYRLATENGKAFFEMTHNLFIEADNCNKLIKDLSKKVEETSGLDADTLSEMIVQKRKNLQFQEKINAINNDTKLDSNVKQQLLANLDSEYKASQDKYLKKQAEKFGGENTQAYQQFYNNYTNNADIDNIVRLEKKQKECYETAIQYERKLKKEEAETNKILKIREERLGLIKNIIKGAWNAMKQPMDRWRQFNQLTNNTAKSIGMHHKETMAYQRALMQTSKELARSYGLQYEQVAKIQDSYAEASSRAAILTADQTKSVAAITKLLGESTVNTGLENIDNLGGGIETASKAIGKAMFKANSMGLNAVKASSVFAKNLSMANKYSFRNGVDGISKMTMLSQKLKFNLESMGGVIDNFSSISGAISTSANLQMMGGEAAMLFGNPMEAMHDALMNPELLVEKMTKAFASKATFNTKTGMSELNGYNLQWVKQVAQAMGMNPEEAVQIAKQQAKISEIDKHLSTSIKSDEQLRNIIESKAEWNEKNKQFEISYFKEGSSAATTVSLDEIKDNPELIEQLKEQKEPIDDIQEHVRLIAQELTSTKELETGIKEAYETAKAQLVDLPMNAYTDNLLRTAVQGDDRFAEIPWLSWIGKGVHGILNWITNGEWWGTGAVLIGAAILSPLKGLLKSVFTKGGGARSVTNKTNKTNRTNRASGTNNTNGGANAAPKKSTPKPKTAKPKNVKKPTPKPKTAKPKIEWESEERFYDEKGKLRKIQRVSKPIENKAPSKLTKLKSLATKGKTNFNVARASGVLKGAAITSVIAGVIVGFVKFNEALDNAKKSLNKFDEELVTVSEDGNGPKEIYERFSEKERTKLEERAKYDIEHNGDRTNAVGAGVGTALGGIVGGAIGSFFGPGLGTAIGAAAGAFIGEKIGSVVSAHDNRTTSDITQEQYETAKLGVSAINVDSNKLKDNAAIATIKMHDILISMWYHMNGKQSNGAIDEEQQSWGERFWDSAKGWFGLGNKYAKQSDTHYIQTNVDTTAHANEGDIGDSNTTLAIPQTHPLAKAYETESQSNDAKVLVANTNETVVSKDKITNLGNAFNELTKSTNAYGTVNSNEIGTTNDYATSISEFKGDNVSTLTVNDFDKNYPIAQIESQPVVGSQANTVNPISTIQINNTASQQQNNNQPLNMNVNFSGEIKLQGTNSQPIDIQKWCRDNPIEFTKLTRLIMQSMIAQNSGGERRGQYLI